MDQMMGIFTYLGKEIPADHKLPHLYAHVNEIKQNWHAWVCLLLVFNPDVLFLPLQTCIECPNIPQDAQVRLCRETVEDHAADWWGPHTNSTCNCMVESGSCKCIFSV